MKSLKRDSLLDDKRGASVDNFFALAAFFGTVIFILAVIVFWNNVAGLDKLWGHNPTTETIKGDAQSVINLVDFMLVLAWVGLHLGIIVLGFLLRTHPAILVVAVLLTAVLAVFAAPLSNAYTEATDTGELSTAVKDIPVTDFIMQNLPLFEVMWAALTMVIMFALSRAGGGKDSVRGVGRIR